MFGHQNIFGGPPDQCCAPYLLDTQNNVGEHIRRIVLWFVFVRLMVKSGLLQSKGEATRLIKNRGAYLNNEKVEDVSTLICQKDLVGGKYLIIGAGKKKKMLISVE